MSSFLDFAFSSFICIPSRVRCIERTSKFLVINNTTNFVLFQEILEHLFLKSILLNPFTIYTHNFLKTNAGSGICPRCGTLIYMESPKGRKYGFLDLWQDVQEYQHWEKFHCSLFIE